MSKTKGKKTMRPITYIIIPIFQENHDKSVVPLLNDISRLGYNLSLNVIVMTNNLPLEEEAVSILESHRWEHIRSSNTMSDLRFRTWCYDNVIERRGTYFFQIYPYAVLSERFFDIAIGTWERIKSHPKSVLNLTGQDPIPKRRNYTDTQQTSSPDHTFITDKSGIQILKSQPIPPTRYPVWLAKGNVISDWGTIYLVKEALPEIEYTEIPEPVQEEPEQSKTIRKATFIVATHHRPDMLECCLEHLQQQYVPNGWTYNILVSGMNNDPGMMIAKKTGVKYLVSPSPTVTSKLNLMLENTDAVLIMKADDDDIQPPDRLQAAVEAYRKGAAWSGVGKLYFYDIHENRVMRWKGQAEWGLVGTSMNYNADLLKQVKGWPSRVKGEDGAIATLIKNLKAPFIDTTDKMGAILCIQHGDNLYPRPVVEANQRATRGGFVIHGEGTLQQSSLPDSIKTIPLLNYRPHTPVYVPTDPVPKQDKEPKQVAFKKSLVVGIGICSFDRPKDVERWAQNLLTLTQEAAASGIVLKPVLSTCDTDPPPFSILGVPCIHRTNLGVAWVKNNALRYMFEQGCDYFFLVEDDCHIRDWSFFHQYVKASQICNIHHMMYGPIREWENTWTLIRNTRDLSGFKFVEYKRNREPQSTPGVITFHSRHALEVSGGMDMRFVGRGHGHKEWTDRTIKLLQLRNEHPFEHPLWMLDIPENQNVSFSRDPSRGMQDKALIARNKNILDMASPRPCYDFLWTDVNFKKMYGNRDLWSYLNGKYPYSLINEDNSHDYDKGLEGDKKLFHKLGVSHPADPISICISLKNRMAMLEGFINYMNLSVDDPSLYEIVITDFNSNDCDLHKVLQKSKVPFKVVSSTDQFFSRGKGLHLSGLAAQHDLLMFFDIDMAVSSPLYWAWIRRHTSPTSAVFPICYGLHKNAPMEIHGNTKNPTYSNGFWRDEGFGMAAFHREAYLKVGGWDYRITRWGGEDNDIYWHCKNNEMNIVRRKSEYLFHRWHPETADYKDPYGDKNQKTLQGQWKDPQSRGVGCPIPSEVLKGYDD